MRRIYTGIWIGLVVVGIIFRFSLLTLSLEYDELFTAITVNPALSLSQIISQYLIIDVHPPLFNILLWGWTHIAPWTSEISLHIPSLLYSLLTLGIGWFCFPRRFGKTARILFILLLSCSATNLHYASQARSYSLLLLLSTGFMFSALHILDCLHRNLKLANRSWLLYAGLGLLLSYTHYFGLAVFCSVSVLLVGWMWYTRHISNKLLVAMVGVFLLACLWLIPNLLYNLQIGRFSGNWWAQQYTLLALLVEFSQFLFTGEQITAWIGIFNIFVWLYFVKHLKNPDYQNNQYELIFLVGTVVMVLVGALVISIKAFMMVPRFFTSVLPFMYLAYALFLAPFLKRFPLAWSVFLSYIVWNLVCFGQFWQARTYFPTEGAKQFAQFLYQEYTDRELFVVVKDGLPDEALYPMMSWYVNQYYHRDTPTTILNILSDEEFAKTIARRSQAVIWMPMCSSHKLQRIWQEQQRLFAVKYYVGTSCVLEYRPLSLVKKPKKTF